MLTTNRKLRKRVEDLFKFRADKKKLYYLFIFCLLFSVAFLMEWGKETFQLTLQLKSEQELLSPVYSTPVSLEGSVITVATHRGNIFWYDIITAKILAQTHSESPIIAPIAKLNVNNDDSFEILTPLLKNSYVVYESTGSYLFKGREESPIKSFVAKPIVFNFRNKTYLLLVDQEGHVELVESSYGKKVWQTSLTLSPDENIISSPILSLIEDRQCVFIAGNKGSVIAMNVLTGQIYWHKRMEYGFISTGVISQEDSQWMNKLPIVNLLGINGVFLQINALSGDVLSIQKIDTEATSSVAGFQKKGQSYFVLLGKNGSIHLYDGEILTQLYQSADDGPFQASPILSDFDGDGQLDIIGVHSSGKIVIVDFKGELLGEPYYLNAEVTATPLLTTASKKTYLIVASENGKLFVLVIKKGDEDIQVSHSYLEFLYNSKNNYYL